MIVSGSSKIQTLRFMTQVLEIYSDGKTYSLLSFFLLSTNVQVYN